MQGIVTAAFFDADPPESTRVVDSTVSVCRDLGFSNGEPVTSATEEPTEGVTNVEFSYPSESGYGSKTLYANVDSQHSGISDPFLDLGVAAEYLGLPDDRPDEYKGFTRAFVRLVRTLAVRFDPTYVVVFQSPQAGRGPSPQEVLPENESFELDRLPWLSIYSESLLERFDWDERVMNAPAWKVERFDTGGVMIIKTKEPLADVSRDHPLDRYLLDGDGSAARSADPADLDLGDPFASLDSGEFGAEVGVHREDLSWEFENDDLELIRVYVDEDRNLRRVDTDAFVRNVVDEDLDDESAVMQGMFADPPPDAREADVRVSALLHDAVPAEFVRLDDPDDENVVTKVMELDVDLNKFDFLVTLTHVAGQDDFTAADLATIEQALDKLTQLEDTDGVEQYIEERFL